MFEKYYQIPRDAHLIQDSEKGLYAPEQAFEYHRKRQEEKDKLLKN
jgi:hypothetical protein